MAIERSQVTSENRWDTAALFPSLEKWQEAFDALDWSPMDQFKGRLGERASVLNDALKIYFDLSLQIERLYVYAHLCHDEDLADEKHKGIYDRIATTYHQFSTATAWLEPEILQLPEETAKDPQLAEFAIYLEKLMRMKPHTLEAKEEELLALAGKSLSTPQSAFTLFNNADVKFPDAVNEKGEALPVSHAKYSLYLQTADRALRKSAYESLLGSFKSFENTVCELFSGSLQKDLFIAKARGYKDCLEAALFPNQISSEVYHSLLKAAGDRIGALHRYISMRKNLLGVDKLYFYDLYVPLVPDVKMEFTFDEAVDLIIDSLEVMGEEYQTTLREGLSSKRWVDRYENLRKRSGAYSSGSYRGLPYILMNYNGLLNDMMTLTHEAGHSMHSYTADRAQSYQNAGYPIFLAEIASTFHEELLFRHLLKKVKTEEERCFLLNQKIEGLRATFFRQILFADFELKAHHLVEKGMPLTPQILKKTYAELNRTYYGSDLELDELIEAEFMRVPHFYTDFYVYQYASGISAAYAFAEQVEKEGTERYMGFLSAGGSDYPLETLKKAGVDLTKPAVFENLIDYFDQLVGEFEESLSLISNS